MKHEMRSYPGISMDRLKKTAKASIRIDRNPNEVRSGCLSNTNLQRNGRCFHFKTHNELYHSMLHKLCSWYSGVQ